ncbi:hypothetical protein [Spirosoma sp.]|uniref:hypothetical protein n=1 Tax=Spirosoma sp. TaxID=1899569 RepID=UPI003B3A2263
MEEEVYTPGTDNPAYVLASWLKAVQDLYGQYDQLSTYIQQLKTNKQAVGTDPLITLQITLQTEFERLLQEMDQLTTLPGRSVDENYQKLLDHTTRLKYLSEQVKTKLGAKRKF